MIIVTDLGKFRSVKGLLNYMIDNRIRDVYMDYIRIGGYAPNYVVKEWKDLNCIRTLYEESKA